ncbi:unnamed protein product [Rotaria sp. Silwood2]|nr:unnamed protein product [Rotaria sp. Silwood2]CAF4306179.1 unnamed protein product [Rotaria sp. Silwood2]CAF4423565.1 unnamed protein product [Rotaria sp. Silwood2]
MMNDLCHAVVYIRNHINEHCPDADSNQIFLSGHSGGALLISLLVLDKSHLIRHEFPLSSIRCVISISGIYNLANPAHDSQNNIRNWLFRILYSKDEELPTFLVMSARFYMGLQVDAKRFVEKL